MKKWQKITLISIVYFFILILLGYLSIPAISIFNLYSIIYLALYIIYPILLIIYFFKDKIIERYKRKRKNYYRAIVFSKNKINVKKIKIEEKFKLKNLLTRGICSTIVLIIIFGAIMSIAGSKLFCSKIYASQMEIEESSIQDFDGNFSYGEEVLLPIIDKDIAFKLAQSKLLTYGSQYNIDYDNFTILSVNRNGSDQLVRIAPLEYADFFVALNRMNSGTVGYIEVNVVTQEAKLIEVEGGMKYMPSAILNYDLDRHIRFNYPTALFDEKYFEIDDDGHPYWVVPTFENEIALFNGKKPNGIIIVDPINGQTNKYSLEEHNEPKWVDRVVSLSIVEAQATNALMYKNGFYNTIFGSKKDVFTLSDGYNYFIKDGQTYYVSCITSPNENDQTSIGFITINLKTKEAKKYLIPGITEMRAREIAMQHEDVKAQKLEATWPILIDYQGVPTYFMVLKNDVQVMRYVFVDVESGVNIVLETSLEKAKIEYEKTLNHVSNLEKTIIGTVDRVRFDEKNVYFTIIGYDQYFMCENNLNVVTMFLQSGDKVEINYIDFDDYNYVKEIKLIN